VEQSASPTTEGGPAEPGASNAARTPDVTLSGISKRYGDVVAIDHVDLEVAPGEFFTMLGPSGSGKTTTLRMIAGFDVPDTGRVEIAGQDVTDLPAYDREVNTVFQDYALFPHMTVAENVEYGLRVAGIAKGERGSRAADALEMVRLGDYGTRKPAELSGGQRQRVALARAIVNQPRVLLLDEPLGALDLKLREQMQVELKSIQSDVGITFIYVTHDQEEALTMSDRVAVFNEGRIEQVGPPAEIYERPGNPFMRSALVAGALLAFALSFDEIIVTTFTVGAGDQTLPIWILTNFSRPNQLPIVNVVAVFVIVLSIIPVYFAHKLSSEVGTASGAPGAPTAGATAAP